MLPLTTNVDRQTRLCGQLLYALSSHEDLIDVNSGWLLSFLTKILSLFLIHITSDYQIRTQNTLFFYNTSWCDSLLLLTVRTGV